MDVCISFNLNKRTPEVNQWALFIESSTLFFKVKVKVYHFMIYSRYIWIERFVFYKISRRSFKQIGKFIFFLLFPGCKASVWGFRFIKQVNVNG